MSCAGSIQFRLFSDCSKKQDLSFSVGTSGVEDSRAACLIDAEGALWRNDEIASIPYQRARKALHHGSLLWKMRNWRKA